MSLQRQGFTYYMTNSVQGRAGKGPQLSWTYERGGRTYHFLGVTPPAMTAGPSALTSPYGDYAGLDTTELAFIRSELLANAGSALTLVFGHHPVTDTGFLGRYMALLRPPGVHQRPRLQPRVHIQLRPYHDYSQALFSGNPYTGFMFNGGIHYYNVRSLGRTAASYYSVVAIDCNGLSSATPSSNTWPVVLITAPVDKYIGGAVNPYAYTVTASSSNFVRALVFDNVTTTQVSYRIDSGTTCIR